MKARKANDFRNLSLEELNKTLNDAMETLRNQKFQHSLKQLHNAAYLKILKKDIARIKTVINEKSM